MRVQSSLSKHEMSYTQKGQANFPSAMKRDGKGTDADSGGLKKEDEEFVNDGWRKFSCMLQGGSHMCR